MLMAFPLLYTNLNIRIYKSTILPFVLYGCEALPLNSYYSNADEIFNSPLIILVISIISEKSKFYSGGNKM